MTSRSVEAAELLAGAAALGVALDEPTAESLLGYLDQIYVWNRSAGLTSIPHAQALRLHLLDSLSIVPLLPSRGTIADLGSGAGLPGIPIALALKDAEVALVESRRRKCSFLQEVVAQLELRNCTVIQADAHALAQGSRPFDAVTARAFLSPSELLPLASRLVASGGSILVMGARRDQELEQLGTPELVRIEDRRITLPGGSEQRRIVVLRKR